MIAHWRRARLRNSSRCDVALLYASVWRTRPAHPRTAYTRAYACTHCTRQSNPASTSLPPKACAGLAQVWTRALTPMQVDSELYIHTFTTTTPFTHRGRSRTLPRAARQLSQGGALDSCQLRHIRILQTAHDLLERTCVFGTAHLDFFPLGSAQMGVHIFPLLEFVSSPLSWMTGDIRTLPPPTEQNGSYMHTCHSQGRSEQKLDM